MSSALQAHTCQKESIGKFIISIFLKEFDLVRKFLCVLLFIFNPRSESMYRNFNLIILEHMRYFISNHS